MDKRYDYTQSEQEARKLWEQHKVYEFQKTEKQVFSIDTPPPTVSGTLHIGHIFSYTHTDIIARYKRLRGFEVFYPMGFDDNGLPTERYVEKMHKTKAHLMPRSEFIKLCLGVTDEVEKGFEDLWKTMGLSVDWNLTYSSISDKSRKISQHSFLELYKKKLVYRKEEPSLYCTTCRTSVAQAELDSAEISGTFNDVEFTTEDGQPLIVATTRPELLLSAVALFYHPDDKRYAPLNGKMATVPVSGKKIPIMPDKDVDPEKGSGIVFCGTLGDQTDIIWCKRYNLPFIQLIGFDGVFVEAAGPLQGLRVPQARKKIIELLGQAGVLKEQKAIKRPVSVHERCKQEIEFQVLNQWFVNILDHKDKFLALADEINWKPAFMKARYKDWVEHLNWDWCISRQRYYGIAFPVWHCKKCSEVIVASAAELPVDPQEQMPAVGSCPSCSSTDLVGDTDVMDTWNTSSLTPQINANWPEEQIVNMPMSMRPQAHDIIRTWAFYTIVKAYYHHNQIPWKDIMISGHVLAGKEKISKSKGNQKMAPEALLKTYPADVIRFWSASGKLGADTAFSENQLKIGQKLVTKLWNAFRFCKESIEQHQPDRKPKNLDKLNEWLVHEFSKTVQEYCKYFDTYEYSHALDCIERFFWQTFCDNYLELVKDRFFNADSYDAHTIQATQFTMYEIGFGILQLYAPFLPHITENLYQQFYQANAGEISIHQTVLDLERYSYSFEQSAQLAQTLLRLVDQVRKLKSEQQVSLKTPLKMLSIYSDDDKLLQGLSLLEKEIMGISKASKVVFEKGQAQTAIEGNEDNLQARVCL